jgi:hypothetical protein
MGRHVKNRILDSGALTVQIPDVTTDQRPAGIDGDIIFNKTTQTFQGYIGSQWYNISSAAGEKTIVVDKFQGDGSTFVFGAGQGNTYDGSTAATFSTDFNDATDILVFVGGIAQVAGTNYTVSGTYPNQQITFGSAPPANDGTTNGHVITVVQNLQKLGQ